MIEQVILCKSSCMLKEASYPEVSLWIKFLLRMERNPCKPIVPASQSICEIDQGACGGRNATVMETYMEYTGNDSKTAFFCLG